MFTGIIEEQGTIKAINRGAKSVKLNISCEEVLSDLSIGDSVATNGVCLTVTSIGESGFTADVMNETMKRSTLGELTQGSKVNLERAMKLGGRFGGHMVSGHIDGRGRIKAIKRDDIAVWYTVSAESNIMKYIIEKGSITIDGISLTVAKVSDVDFSVSVIPHTAKETNLSEKRVGSWVNLENDIIGKYVEKMLGGKNDITEEFLINNGF